jgi:hypothetical protein
MECRVTFWGNVTTSSPHLTLTLVFHHLEMLSTSAPGSGGLVITPQMRTILKRPGHLSEKNGGQLLRQLYSQRERVLLPLHPAELTVTQSRWGSTSRCSRISR